MRDVREVMRLYREGGQAVREIARLSGIARSTVREMIARFERSGLAWPVPPDIADAELERRLYGAPGVKPGRRKQPEPDWSVVARATRRHLWLRPVAWWACSLLWACWWPCGGEKTELDNALWITCGPGGRPMEQTEDKLWYFP